MWSDTDGWIEAEVVWSGSTREAIPGVGGIVRRCDYLTEGGHANSERSNHATADRYVFCACGKRRSVDSERCRACWKEARSVQHQTPQVGNACAMCLSIRGICRQCQARKNATQQARTVYRKKVA